jgi:lysophospholipase L1-like esterase
MKKLALFGDSITAGWMGSQTSNVLPLKIEDYVEKMHVTPLEIFQHGVPGEDTNMAMERLNDVAASDADLNIVFFGANDASMHHNVSVREFEENLTAMAKKLSASKTWFITPPYHNDFVENEDRNNKYVEEYRKAAIDVARKLNTESIDLFKHMTLYKAPNDFLQPDGLHFSADGYELLASLIVAKIRDTGFFKGE